MTMVQVAIPGEMLALLARSPLANRPREDQVKVALAIYLFREGIISVGRASELAGEPRAAFELLLGSMDVPPVRYDVADYEREWDAIERARGEHAGRP